MAISLTTSYLDELRKRGANAPCVIVELLLDAGNSRWGVGTFGGFPWGEDFYTKYGTHTGGFSDVSPVLKSVSSLQNKLDTKKNYSTRGQLSVVMVGRDNFKNVIKNNYLKNSRVVRKDGFLGLTSYSDYAATFKGKVSDWSRKGDELTLIVSDELEVATTKIPVENATKTQNIDYRNTNPVDIMQDIIKTQLGVDASFVDDTQFDAEQATWMVNWKFDRVLTDPKKANQYLNELQVETNSFIFHDGDKVSFKVFAPAVPGQNIPVWSDDNQLLRDTLSQKSGYKDQFFNRVVVYYDYDESGSDSEENFEAAVISTDSTSQSSQQWDETETKIIKSKWIRTLTYTQASNVTGVVIYHISKANGAGDGTLTYSNTANTLTWTPNGGTVGTAIEVTNDGKYQIKGSDETKYIRVIVTTGSLPSADKNDTITVSSLDGASYASQLADRILIRYRNPVSIVTCNIDINAALVGSNFLKVSDLVDFTTDEAMNKGSNTWTTERLMITSFRPDFTTSKAKVEAIETQMSSNYGFIAPAGQPDWDSATAAQKEYGYIGDATNNQLGAANDAGFYIW